MEADHYQPATRFQQLRRRFQQFPQVVQFAVYEYSESLKGARRGMNSAFSLIHWPGRGRNHGCELGSRQYRPRPDNGSGDSPRPPFLTEFVNQIGKLALVELVYHLFGGRLRLRIHSHVERSVRLKTKAARGIRKLQAADTKVDQYPVNRR